MLRSLVLAFVCTLGAGCSTSREAVVTPAATPAAAVSSIVSPPLAGVDSLVVMVVAASFDSTFVAAAAERASEARFLEGRQVQARLDSLLRQLHGAGPLQRAVAGDSTALAEGQRIAVAAARAQAQQDSMQALALLGDAQRLFEEALQHNPHHADARYQLAELYKIQARQYRDQRRWGTVLQMLRGLLTLNADQHVLWAELATVLDTLRQHEASGLAWMQAASVVLDDANLTFATEAPAPDSLTLFSYYQRAYSVFVQDRHGAGVREALSLAIDYATDSTQHAYATGEWAWARWDGPNFEHRLAFDSLLTVATHDPQGARQGLATLSPRLGQRSAWLEASYNWAILTWQLQEQDRALDTLQGLWGVTRAATPMPYEEFPAELRDAYASLLFQRGLQHRQAGASAKAFTYLLMVTELGSPYTGPAYIEALKLTRSNPQQARQLEPRIESVFGRLTPEEQRTYLSLMGNLYRRIGEAEQARAFLARYRAVNR